MTNKTNVNDYQKNVRKIWLSFPYMSNDCFLMTFLKKLFVVFIERVTWSHPLNKPNYSSKNSLLKFTRYNLSVGRVKAVYNQRINSMLIISSVR